MTTRPVDPGKFMPAPGKPGVWLIESRSEPGTHHTLSNIGTGFETCTCKAFEIRGTCAHLTAILAQLDPFLDNVPRSNQRGESMSVPTRAVSVQEHEPPIYSLAPRLADMAEQFHLVRQFVKEQMVLGVDYGTIPGTGDRLNLLKPGAEKLAELYGFSLRVKDISETANEVNGFYRTRITAQVVRRTDDCIIAEGVGEANSYEANYRWRNANRFCPECGTDAIIKGKEEYGGGWICFKKKGGCGAKYRDDDRQILEQAVGRVENDDLFGTWNTILKMAHKRANIDAVLAATRSSSLFTQDMGEDEPEPASPAPPSPPPGTGPKAPPPPDAKPSVAARTGQGAPKPPLAYPWEEELRAALSKAGISSADLAVTLGVKPTFKTIDAYMRGTGFSIQEMVWECVAKLEAQREAALPADIDEKPDFDPGDEQ